MSLFLAVLFGIGFGYILQRVGAFEYKNIINALRLKDLTIPKFMLFSVAITCVGIFSLRSAGFVSLDLITTNPVGNIVGGLIFGVGFALAGYCPGTSIGAMGEGKRDAKYTVIGGIFGVLLYTLLQQYTSFSITKFDIGKVSLADIVPINSFSAAVAFSFILVAIIYAIDFLEQRKSSVRGNKNVQR